jgi:hypothetical protein
VSVWVVDLAMFAGVVILSLALYVIPKTVDRNLALLALLWRMMEAVLGGVTVLAGLLVVLLLNGGEYTPCSNQNRSRRWSICSSALAASDSQSSSSTSASGRSSSAIYCSDLGTSPEVLPPSGSSPSQYRSGVH